MKYHKIDSVFFRDEKNKRFLVEGQFSRPEFEYLKDVEWSWFEKIDGTNIRVYWDEKVTFQGRDHNSQIPADLVNWLNDKFIISEIFEKVVPDMNIILYGEGYGKGIQKAGKSYDPFGVSFILFDVMALDCDDGDLFLSRRNVEGIASELKLEVAPLIFKGTIQDAIDKVKGGFKSLLGDIDAEGLVGHPTIELHDRRHRRIITKIKTRDFPDE